MPPSQTNPRQSPRLAPIPFNTNSSLWSILARAYSNPRDGTIAVSNIIEALRDLETTMFFGDEHRAHIFSLLQYQNTTLITDELFHSILQLATLFQKGLILEEERQYVTFSHLLLYTDIINTVSFHPQFVKDSTGDKHLQPFLAYHRNASTSAPNAALQPTPIRLSSITPQTLTSHINQINPVPEVIFGANNNHGPLVQVRPRPTTQNSSNSLDTSLVSHSPQKTTADNYSVHSGADSFEDEFPVYHPTHPSQPIAAQTQPNAQIPQAFSHASVSKAPNSQHQHEPVHITPHPLPIASSTPNAHSSPRQPNPSPSPSHINNSSTQSSLSPLNSAVSNLQSKITPSSPHFSSISNRPPVPAVQLPPTPSSSSSHSNTSTQSHLHQPNYLQLNPNQPSHRRSTSRGDFDHNIGLVVNAEQRSSRTTRSTYDTTATPRTAPSQPDFDESMSQFSSTMHSTRPHLPTLTIPGTTDLPTSATAPSSPANMTSSNTSNPAYHSSTPKPQTTLSSKATFTASPQFGPEHTSGLDAFPPPMTRNRETSTTHHQPPSALILGHSPTVTQHEHSTSTSTTLPVPPSLDQRTSLPPSNNNNDVVCSDGQMPLPDTILNPGMLPYPRKPSTNPLHSHGDAISISSTMRTNKIADPPPSQAQLAPPPAIPSRPRTITTHHSNTNNDSANNNTNTNNNSANSHLGGLPGNTFNNTSTTGLSSTAALSSFSTGPSTTQSNHSLSYDDLHNQQTPQPSHFTPNNPNTAAQPPSRPTPPNPITHNSPLLNEHFHLDREIAFLSSFTPYLVQNQPEPFSSPYYRQLCVPQNSHNLHQLLSQHPNYHHNPTAHFINHPYHTTPNGQFTQLSQNSAMQNRQLQQQFFLTSLSTQNQSYQPFFFTQMQNLNQQVLNTQLIQFIKTQCQGNPYLLQSSLSQLLSTAHPQGFASPVHPLSWQIPYPTVSAQHLKRTELCSDILNVTMCPSTFLSSFILPSIQSVIATRDRVLIASYIVLEKSEEKKQNKSLEQDSLDVANVAAAAQAAALTGGTSTRGLGVDKEALNSFSTGSSLTLQSISSSTNPSIDSTSSSKTSSKESLKQMTKNWLLQRREKKNAAVLNAQNIIQPDLTQFNTPGATSTSKPGQTGATTNDRDENSETTDDLDDFEDMNASSDAIFPPGSPVSKSIKVQHPFSQYTLLPEPITTPADFALTFSSLYEEKLLQPPDGLIKRMKMHNIGAANTNASGNNNTATWGTNAGTPTQSYNTSGGSNAPSSGSGFFNSTVVQDGGSATTVLKQGQFTKTQLVKQSNIIASTITSQRGNLGKVTVYVMEAVGLKTEFDQKAMIRPFVEAYCVTKSGIVGQEPLILQQQTQFPLMTPKPIRYASSLNSGANTQQFGPFGSDPSMTLYDDSQSGMVGAESTVGAMSSINSPTATIPTSHSSLSNFHSTGLSALQATLPAFINPFLSSKVTKIDDTPVNSLNTLTSGIATPGSFTSTPIEYAEVATKERTYASVQQQYTNNISSPLFNVSGELAYATDFDCVCIDLYSHYKDYEQQLGRVCVPINALLRAPNSIVASPAKSRAKLQSITSPHNSHGHRPGSAVHGGHRGSVFGKDGKDGIALMMSEKSQLNSNNPNNRLIQSAQSSLKANTNSLTEISDFIPKCTKRIKGWLPLLDINGKPGFLGLVYVSIELVKPITIQPSCFPSIPLDYLVLESLLQSRQKKLYYAQMKEQYEHAQKVLQICHSSTGQNGQFNAQTFMTGQGPQLSQNLSSQINDTGSSQSVGTRQSAHTSNSIASYPISNSYISSTQIPPRLNHTPTGFSTFNLASTPSDYSAHNGAGLDTILQPAPTPLIANVSPPSSASTLSSSTHSSNPAQNITISNLLDQAALHTNNPAAGTVFADPNHIYLPIPPPPITIPTIDCNVHAPTSSQNNSSSPSQSYQKSASDLLIYSCTFNVGNTPLSTTRQQMEALIPQHSYDIYVIGLQEAKYDSPRQEWKNVRDDILGILSIHLGSGYSILRYHSLWQIRLLIFVREPLLPRVHSIQAEHVATGELNLLGNKGGVLISFSIDTSRLCFISCHLAAHQDRAIERNENVRNIFKEAKMGMKYNVPNTIHSHQNFIDVYNQFDVVVIVGDMNYRLNWGPQNEINSRTPSLSSFNALLTTLTEAISAVQHAQFQHQQRIAQHLSFLNFDNGGLSGPLPYNYDPASHQQQQQQNLNQYSQFNSNTIDPASHFSSMGQISTHFNQNSSLGSFTPESPLYNPLSRNHCYSDQHHPYNHSQPQPPPPQLNLTSIFNSPVIQQSAYTISQIVNNSMKSLLVGDQLSIMQQQKKVFYGFQEAQITFPPTFKVARTPALKYLPQRLPSWCDRILWKVRGGLISIDFNTNENEPLSFFNQVNPVQQAPPLSGYCNVGQNLPPQVPSRASIAGMPTPAPQLQYTPNSAVASHLLQCPSPSLLTHSLESPYKTTPATSGQAATTTTAAGTTVLARSSSSRHNPGDNALSRDQSHPTIQMVHTVLQPTLRCLDYNYIPTLATSDHKPVYSIFSFRSSPLPPRRDISPNVASWWFKDLRFSLAFSQLTATGLISQQERKEERREDKKHQDPSTERDGKDDEKEKKSFIAGLKKKSTYGINPVIRISSELFPTNLSYVAKASKNSPGFKLKDSRDFVFQDAIPTSTGVYEKEDKSKKDSKDFKDAKDKDGEGVFEGNKDGTRETPIDLLTNNPLVLLTSLINVEVYSGDTPLGFGTVSFNHVKTMTTPHSTTTFDTISQAQPHRSPTTANHNNNDNQPNNTFPATPFKVPNSSTDQNSHFRHPPALTRSTEEHCISGLSQQDDMLSNTIIPDSSAQPYQITSYADQTAQANNFLPQSPYSTVHQLNQFRQPQQQQQQQQQQQHTYPQQQQQQQQQTNQFHLHSTFSPIELQHRFQLPTINGKNHIPACILIYNEIASQLQHIRAAMDSFNKKPAQAFNTQPIYHFPNSLNSSQHPYTGQPLLTSCNSQSSAPYTNIPDYHSLNPTLADPVASFPTSSSDLTTQVQQSMKTNANPNATLAAPVVYLPMQPHLVQIQLLVQIPLIYSGIPCGEINGILTITAD